MCIKRCVLNVAISVARQPNDELRAAVSNAQVKLASVSLDDSASDCHAKSRAFGLGREERVEDLATYFGYNPQPVVLDLNLDRRIVVQFDHSAVDSHDATVRRRIDRVLEDVSEHLPGREPVNRAAKVCFS